MRQGALLYCNWVSVYPDDNELLKLLPGKDSILHSTFADSRLYLGAGHALILQVAHPTVNAGVVEHSQFEKNPWSRLIHTVDYLMMMSRSGQQAIEVGRRIREMHKSIKGIDKKGKRYHALEPGAYSWVHASLIWSAVETYQTFIGSLGFEQKRAFYQEYKDLGQLIGVRDKDLPPTWLGFEDYCLEMIETTLENTETAQAVMRLLSNPPSPSTGQAVIDQGLSLLWPVLKIAPRSALKTATYGLLGKEICGRFNTNYSRLDRLRFAALRAASLGAGRIMPERIWDGSGLYLRLRRNAIESGPMGTLR
jgi:uncharacterized protein (DUF2236 family)